MRAGMIRMKTMPTGPILIVDDDLDIREILAETLGDRGFSVMTAANGLEALRVLRRTAAAPSAILLDLMMPVMDGYGFMEQLEHDPELADIPVAIITAGHGVDEARLAGARSIIRKPIDMPKLLRLLAQLDSSGAATR
jgi:CheY-like chemotaxis protein